MNDGLRLLSGSILFSLLALRCTKLESGSDVFASASLGSNAGTAGHSATPENQGGAPGGAPASMAGGSGVGGAGTSGKGGTAGHGAVNGPGGGEAGQREGQGGDSGTSENDAGAGGEPGAAGSPGPDCIDETGFDGRGCYRCTPTDIVTLEQACTGASCTHFDNQLRLTLLPSDGHLPELPGQSGAGGGGGAGAGGAGGVAGSGASAGAAGSTGVGLDCASLATSGQLVYVTGSSAAKPFLQQIAQQLASTGVYLVYTSTGSCIGVDAVVNGTPMKTGAAPAPAASATYWDSTSSTGKACDLPLEGVAADLGISDVFAATCPGFELTDLDALGIRDAHGPIQTMTFAVPTNSPYSEISAQAAYFVFGFGSGGGVQNATGAAAIWNDESYLFQRNAGSGTQAMLASAIGVPAGSWKGKTHKTSDDVSAALQNAAASEQTAEKALGILAADYIDTKNLRAQIKVLAYQDTHQPCAVFPDSTGTAHDKANVRDGHYPIWSPLHLLYKTDQAGNPLNPDTREAMGDIVGYLSGTKALPNGVKLLDVYAQSGLVPECAMRVKRTKDGGNLSPSRPSSPCSCLFELKATGVTTCAACTVQGDCAADESCSQGYCEK